MDEEGNEGGGPRSLYVSTDIGTGKVAGSQEGGGDDLRGLEPLGEFGRRKNARGGKDTIMTLCTAVHRG
jgi:hypothetical protein